MKLNFNSSKLNCFLIFTSFDLFIQEIINLIPDVLPIHSFIAFLGLIKKMIQKNEMFLKNH